MSLFKNNTESKTMDDVYFILDSNIKHQNIGSKKAYISRRLTHKELDDAIDHFNIAAINFAKRRPDLININSFENTFFTDKGLEPLYYYYVKIYNNPDHVNNLWGYFGYVICSDEISYVVDPISNKTIHKELKDRIGDPIKWLKN